VRESGFEYDEPGAGLRALVVHVDRTRWAFRALAFYLLSQAVMIPVVAIGPSWALWPRVADLATAALVAAAFMNRRYLVPASSGSRSVERALIWFVAVCAVSYCGYLLFVGHAAGTINGGYYMLRLVEFGLAYAIISRIPLTPERAGTLRRAAAASFWIVCIGVAVTYFNVLPLAWLTAHLPESEAVAGPWSQYAHISGRTGYGWGTISYNHAYGAAQILLLLCLWIHLGGDRRPVRFVVYCAVAVVACFLSGSRAGLASTCLFLIAYWSTTRSLGFTIAAGCAAALVALAGMQAMGKLDATGLDSTTSRHEALLNPTEAGSLSGRRAIWADRIALLDAEPVRWFTGVGLGAARDTGSNAHMLYLQLVVELGAVGLFVFGVLFARILYWLRLYEGRNRALFWCTVALLIASLTQETFYPVPALGHFAGFYLCTVAIALRIRPATVETLLP